MLGQCISMLLAVGNVYGQGSPMVRLWGTSEWSGSPSFYEPSSWGWSACNGVWSSELAGAAAARQLWIHFGTSWTSSATLLQTILVYPGDGWWEPRNLRECHGVWAIDLAEKCPGLAAHAGNCWCMVYCWQCNHSLWHRFDRENISDWSSLSWQLRTAVHHQQHVEAGRPAAAPSLRLRHHLRAHPLCSSCHCLSHGSDWSWTLPIRLEMWPSILDEDGWW